MLVTIRNEKDPIYDDQTSGKYPSSLTREELEDVVKLEWLDLYNHLKPCGVKALRQHLQSLGINNLPSERTLGRILEKQSLTSEPDRYHPWNERGDLK